MELNYYWEFLILSDVKNYSVAAQRLFLSEPSLFRHIKALEDEYKAPLFDKSSRGLELNEYGKALIPIAQRIIEDVNESRSAIQTIRARHNSALRITSGYPISRVIEEFSVQNPDVSCHLIDNHGTTADILDDLYAGKIDLAFVRNAPEDAPVQKIVFAKDYYAAVMSVNHHLANRRRVRISELREERFISFATDHECNDTLLRLCSSAGFEPNVVTIAPNGLEAASITKYGGIAILMGNTMVSDTFHQIRKEGVDNTLAIVDLDPHEDVEISLVYLSGTPLRDDVHRFVDFITDTWLEQHPAAI